MLLRNGNVRITVDAAHGGVLRDFSWRGMAVLRPAASAAVTEPLMTACFPLVPYANRIAHGRFTFQGTEVSLRPNWDQDPHPLHGQGWRAAWAVDQSSAAAATLMFAGGGDEWPWRYRATQAFEVLADGLKVRLSVENLADRPMPAMLGLHPYFPDGAAAAIEAQATTVWLTDAQALPVEEVAIPPRWSFARPRPAAGIALDHCLDHWDGVAMVRWPDRVVTLTATGCPALHVYTPASAGFFCLEPQSAAVGALNRAHGGAATLVPGETLAISVEFLLEPA